MKGNHDGELPMCNKKATDFEKETERLLSEKEQVEKRSVSLTDELTVERQGKALVEKKFMTLQQSLKNR